MRHDISIKTWNFASCKGNINLPKINALLIVKDQETMLPVAGSA
jgi:hypothetical protein